MMEERWLGALECTCFSGSIILKETLTSDTEACADGNGYLLLPVGQTLS